jgi:hypothetical protein
VEKRTLRGYVRENLEAIERRNRAGYSLQDIAKKLNLDGVQATYNTLRTAMMVVRKERAAGKSLAAPAPVPTTAPIVEKPVLEKKEETPQNPVVEKNWVSPADLREIFNDTPNLDAMTRAYDAEMKQMKQMKKDQK